MILKTVDGFWVGGRVVPGTPARSLVCSLAFQQPLFGGVSAATTPEGVTHRPLDMIIGVYNTLMYLTRATFILASTSRYTHPTQNTTDASIYIYICIYIYMTDGPREANPPHSEHPF